MWLFIATVAQIILGSSAVFDRVLILKRNFDPFLYAFWVGILGSVAVFLIPFGFEQASPETILVALVAGAVFVSAFFILYKALVRVEASGLYPLIGAFSPIMTLVLSVFFLGAFLTGADAYGFIFLVLGGLFIFWADTRDVRRELVFGALASGFLLAFSYVLSKIVFNETNFITGFFWIKIGGVAVSLALLLVPAWRRRILLSHRATRPEGRMLYFLNRAYAGGGSVLVSYAVSLAHPALVDATQNIKFAVIFIVSYFMLGERLYGRVLAKKLFALFFLCIGIFILSVENYAKALPPLPADRHIEWGVTFSDLFSRQLGLDWRENYRALLTDLRPKTIRLVAYWDEIQHQPGQYDFSVLDEELAGARSIGADVTLALGMKVPRWPECHVPQWAEGLPVADREGALRQYMQAVIERYRGHGEITMWQVENEPYLLFGKCPPRVSGFVDEEVALVHSLDPSRPALVTDGGEFGMWAPAAQAGDVFGTTMYRWVYPKLIGPLFGTVEYPLAPEYFRLKERLTRWLTGDASKLFIVVELQGEPWGSTEINNLSYSEQLRLFGPERFADTITYAKRTGFGTYYLWGEEWWYLLKTRYNDDRVWNEAKSLLNRGSSVR